VIQTFIEVRRLLCTLILQCLLIKNGGISSLLPLTFFFKNDEPHSNKFETKLMCMRILK